MSTVAASSHAFAQVDYFQRINILSCPTKLNRSAPEQNDPGPSGGLLNQGMHQTPHHSPLNVTLLQQLTSNTTITTDK